MLSEFECNEIIKCFHNPEYFIETYIKVQTPYGVKDFILTPEQKEHLDNITKSKEYDLESDRLGGKTSLILAYSLWCATFKNYFTISICFHNRKLANHTRGNLIFMYESLPTWLKLDALINNNRELCLVTGSRVLFSIQSIDSFRGMNLDLVILEDHETYNTNFRREFRECVYPVLKSSIRSQIITTTSY